MSDRKLPADRSERLLNELLKIPVNTICCDCGAANPKWASTSIGCFLCMRCCSIHRKMGTHISKIKSVSLDSWTQEEIDNMKNRGNGKVNQFGMEQYIRAKYERKEFMEGGGGDHQPSRSAYGNTFSGGRGGGGNGVTNSARYTDQVRSLREMGFTDNARNLQVLQSTDGDVQAAVEILCRLGSGPANLSVSSPARSQSLSPSNSTGGGRRSSPMNTGNAGATGGRDPKEAILWNMGFHDSAMNKEALRRAGGNAEVAAGILIDERDKIAKAVRDQDSSSSPLPARLSPPGRNNSGGGGGGRKEDLLVDLGPTEDEKQQQMQQQQLLMMQRQMQMMQQQQAQGGAMDNNQLQSILNTNANLLAMFDTNNNNNNSMGQMGMGGMGTMSMNNNNQNMFGAGAMSGGLNSNQNTTNMFGTNTNNMFQQSSLQQPAASQPFDNLWSMANTSAATSAPMMSSMPSTNNPFSQMPTGVTSTPPGSMGPNAGTNMFGTPISSAGGAAMGGGMSQTNPFGNAFPNNNNNNMFGAAGQGNVFGNNTPTTSAGMGMGMNAGMGMGMGMGMGQGTTTMGNMGNMGMGGMSPNPNPMMGGTPNNQFNNAFGFNGSNNPPNQNQNQNPHNNWGMY
ncbi:hypothetical protein BGZ73_003732 [Actinomortierella ambigua]|nr:hypothetical protein BGZ73_003732 [Actinomortierella ambigua]